MHRGRGLRAGIGREAGLVVASLDDSFVRQTGQTSRKVRSFWSWSWRVVLSWRWWQRTASSASSCPRSTEKSGTPSPWALAPRVGPTPLLTSHFAGDGGLDWNDRLVFDLLRDR
jgi:hypothetical protein